LICLVSRLGSDLKRHLDEALWSASELLMKPITVLLDIKPPRTSRGGARSCVFSLFPSLLAIFLLLSHSAVCVAQINYGSFSGATVNYIDVTESSTTGDVLPLFGAPLLSADSLDFNPVGFDAGASGPGGTDNTGSRLTFTIQAQAGRAIPALTFGELGDATLSGVGTDNTFAQATAAGTLTINAVDGAAITPIVRPIALAFTPSGGDYGLASDGGGLPIFHTPWNGSLSLNIAQLLTVEGVSFTLGATNISVDLAGVLAARSEAGTEGLIGKKDFGVTVIPEPSSLALCALAISAAIGVARLRPIHCTSGTAGVNNN
jgi:hypothetical protein